MMIEPVGVGRQQSHLNIQVPISCYLKMFPGFQAEMSRCRLVGEQSQKRDKT